MEQLIAKIVQAFLLSFGMFWAVGWSLILGFLISGFLQVFVSKEQMAKMLGNSGIKEIAIATGFGAASSSCSYASASIMRTLLQKGSSFVAAMAFLLASTNLVIELGIVLFVLLGWQFMMGEWIGGIVLVLIMVVLVKVTRPQKLIAEARQRIDIISSQSPQLLATKKESFFEKLISRETQLAIAHRLVMDWSMLWKDLLAGFLIAGFLSEFVSEDIWHRLFILSNSPFLQTVLNALLAPLIAMISFVCSIGNVPMAAVLWGNGVSFGGVLSFLYADLIIFPLLDVYRRYFGWKMAAYMAILLYTTIVISGILMDLAFTGLGLIPTPNPNIKAQMTNFSFNYTFWLNIVFGVIALYFIYLAKKNPAKDQASCCHMH